MTDVKTAVGAADYRRAADELEALLPAFKEAVRMIRHDDGGRKWAYALLYGLRKELGYIVVKYGSGAPTPGLASRVSALLHSVEATAERERP